MHEGATLGRRFTALRTEAHDVPGVERWVAHDSRRDIDVTLDVLVGLAPGAVRQAAVRAAQVRDARFARVLASGRENVGSERVTYVVTERPRGISVSELALERLVPVPIAGSIVGEAARALHVAAGQGIHHGFVRASAIHVTDAGRVVVSGLDADGELATQAGLGRGRTEKADAVGLAQVFLAMVTGMDPEQVTIPDLPSGLTPKAANLARAAVAGTGPSTLSEVSDALGPADAAALRSLRDTVVELPVVHEEIPAATPIALTIAPEALEAAEHGATVAAVKHVSAPPVAQAVQSDKLAVPPVATHAEDENARYATPEEASQFSKGTRRAVERSKHEPLALDAFDDINERQNAGEDRSVAQASLEWAQLRLPQNAVLDAATEHARHRAQRSGPINSGPLLVGLALTALIIIALISFNLLTSPPPAVPGVDPEPDYPSFTYSPSPSPSAPNDE